MEVKSEKLIWLNNSMYIRIGVKQDRIMKQGNRVYKKGGVRKNIEDV